MLSILLFNVLDLIVKIKNNHKMILCDFLHH
ncbi:hypothetical protein C8D90_10385 [Enterobacillus tribolii]|uniref:Uncharacterized protein n=1 Tax=Enterobacillus tribolii TaxID=1487935 RepID=A0A370QTY7_9GAMM|nr:hypothetical protein C8D90_10385 [Enterobacillus tribolii]